MSTFKKVIFNRFAPIALPLLSILFAIGLLTATTTPAYAYIKYGRWSGNSSEFRSYISGAPFPSSSTTLVANAAAKWSQAATGKKFTLNNFQNVSGPVRVSINSANFPANGWPVWPALTVRSSSNGYLTSTAVYMNNTWSWNTSCTLNESTKTVDFRVIITHELGHTVALDHDSNHKESIMWVDYTCKLNLTTDDKNGIGALYP